MLWLVCPIAYLLGPCGMSSSALSGDSSGAAMTVDTPHRLSPTEARAKAEECRALAKTMRNQSHRIMLIHIAETWERIAESSHEVH